MQDALEKSGLRLKVTRLSQSARSVREAAQALGCDPGAIVKSLVFRGEHSGNAYLAEVSGAHRVNLGMLSRAAGEKVTLAAPDFVLSRTGFPVGGVAPVGLPERIDVFIDETLLSQDEIWAAAGSEYAMLRLTPAQLLQLTGGKPVPLADPE